MRDALKKRISGVLMTNQEVQKRAVRMAMRFEIKQNRSPKDISRAQSGEGYDIKSGMRKIEVKGFSGALPSKIVLNYYNYKAYKKNKNFWLYLVYNIDHKPQLVTLHRKDIEGEEYTQFEVQLNKKALTVFDFPRVGVI